MEFIPGTIDYSNPFECVVGAWLISTSLNATMSVLCFAIAHGHSQKDMTEQLLYAASAQLVASFSLILGLVGVPVNVLLGEDSGVDVPQLL